MCPSEGQTRFVPTIAQHYIAPDEFNVYIGLNWKVLSDGRQVLETNLPTRLANSFICANISVTACSTTFFRTGRRRISLGN